MGQTLLLWQDIEPQVVRYRGSLPYKSQKQRKIEKIELLNSVINDTWQSAEELSLRTGISFHQTVKLLQIAAWKFDIEMKHKEWVDESQRQRKRILYKRKKNLLSLYNAIFNIKVPDVPCCAANTRVHICKDD